MVSEQHADDRAIKQDERSEPKDQVSPALVQMAA